MSTSPNFIISNAIRDASLVELEAALNLYPKCIDGCHIVTMATKPKLYKLLVYTLNYCGISCIPKSTIEYAVTLAKTTHARAILNAYLKTYHDGLVATEFEFTNIVIAAKDLEGKSVRSELARFTDPSESFTDYLGLNYPEPNSDMVDECFAAITNDTKFQYTADIGVADVVYSLKHKNLQLFQVTVNKMLYARRTYYANSTERTRVVKYVLMDAVLKACNSTNRTIFSNECVLWLINELDYMNCLVISENYDHFNQIAYYRFEWDEIKYNNVFVAAVEALKTASPIHSFNIIKIIDLLLRVNTHTSSKDLLAVLEYPPLHTLTIRMQLSINCHIHQSLFTSMIKNVTDDEFKEDCMNTAARFGMIDVVNSMINNHFLVPAYALWVSIKNKNETVLKLSEHYITKPSSLLNSIIKLAVVNDYPDVIKQHVHHYTGDRQVLLKYAVKMPSVDVATIAAIL